MKNSFSYFRNEQCEYFPCHKLNDGEFNCLFCYCPLYALGDKCGGNFTFLENGVKDCSNCTIPHTKGGYEHISLKFGEVIKLAKKK